MVLDLFTSLHDLGPTIKVRVTPKASKNYIKVDHQPNDQRLFRVYVTVAPENDKANQAVLKLLAQELGLPKSALEIKAGHKTRDKIISINL